MKKAVSLLSLFAWCAGSVPALLAQQPGLVQGTVEDPNGAAVVQAAVKLAPQAGGAALKSATDATGHFTFTGVAAGEYLLSVKMAGFEKSELRLRVDSSPLPAQKVRLNLADVKDEITVSARSDNPVAAEQNATAVRLDGDFLHDLPAKYDNALTFPSLFVDSAANDVEGTKIVVDGVESSTLDVPSMNVKTVAINNNPYSVEYSRPGKGRIEVTTKPGSLRRFHKRFEYAFRNRSLDARNPFDTFFPPRQRQFAEGEIDGPLAAGKATFYVGGDYLRDNSNTFITAITPAGPVSDSLPLPLRAAHLVDRIDVRITPLHILSLRYNWTENRLPNQGVGAFDLRSRAWNADNHSHELRASETAVLTPAFLNEFRFDLKERPKISASGSNASAILVNGYFNGGGAQISQNDQERYLEFQDLMSYVRGSHSARFGVVLKAKHIDYTDRGNFGGTFSFSDLSSFLNNQPYLYTVNLGNPRVVFNQNEAAYFAQDEVRLLPRLSLMFGVRHELQSNLGDHTNLAPRIALSTSSADSRTILRLGGGIFYQRQPILLQERSMLFGGSNLQQVVLSNPSFPLVGSLADLSSQTPPSLVQTDPRIRAAYSMQTSLSLERKLGRQTSLTAEYILLRGLHLYRMQDVNAPLPSTGLRPDPTLLNVDRFQTSGSSKYHGLTLSLRTTLAGRIQLFSHYTFSQSIDDTAGLFALPADNFNLRAERARSDFDQRHRLNGAIVFRLPWNFNVSSIFTLQSGIPYNITTGFDSNNDTVSNDRPSGGNPSAPFNSFAVDGSFVGGASGVLYDGSQAVFGNALVPIGPNSVRWLILPGPGNVGRNAGLGPGMANVDVRFAKKFVLREKDQGSREIEFRADAFNAVNKANWMNYVGVVSSPFFAGPNDAHPGREIQLSIRLKF